MKLFWEEEYHALKQEVERLQTQLKRMQHAIEAYEGEIAALRAALLWIRDVDPEIVDQATEKFALERTASKLDPKRDFGPATVWEHPDDRIDPVDLITPCDAPTRMRRP